MDQLEEFDQSQQGGSAIADSNELTPWEHTSTNFMEALAQLNEGGNRYHHNLPTEGSTRAAIIRRKRPTRNSTHRNALMRKASEYNKEPLSDASLNVMSPRLCCYASITNSQPTTSQKEAQSTQLFRDGLDDKENIMRLKDSLVESRRNHRLEKIIKIVNPRRTNSILMERSRLRVLVTEQLENRCSETQPREIHHNLSLTNHYRTKLEQHMMAMNQKPRKKLTGDERSELRHLPNVTKQLYEKYSLYKTRSSFRGKMLV